MRKVSDRHRGTHTDPPPAAAHAGAATPPSAHLAPEIDPGETRCCQRVIAAFLPPRFRSHWPRPLRQPARSRHHPHRTAGRCQGRRQPGRRHRAGAHPGHRLQHQALRYRNRVAAADRHREGHREHGCAHPAAGARQPAGGAPGAGGFQVAVHRLRRRLASQPARPGCAGHAGADERPPPVVLRCAGRLPDPVRQHRLDPRRGDRAHGNPHRRRVRRVRHRRGGRRDQRDHQARVPGCGNQRHHRLRAALRLLRRAPGQPHRRLRRPGRGSFQRLRQREPVQARGDSAGRVVRQEARPVLRQQPQLHPQLPLRHGQRTGRVQPGQLLRDRPGHRQAPAGSRAGLHHRDHRSFRHPLRVADVDEQRDRRRRRIRTRHRLRQRALPGRRHHGTLRRRHLYRHRPARQRRHAARVRHHHRQPEQLVRAQYRHHRQPLLLSVPGPQQRLQQGQPRAARGERWRGGAAVPAAGRGRRPLRPAQHRPELPRPVRRTRQLRRLELGNRVRNRGLALGHLPDRQRQPGRLREGGRSVHRGPRHRPRDHFRQPGLQVRRDQRGQRRAAARGLPHLRHPVVDAPAHPGRQGGRPAVQHRRRRGARRVRFQRQPRNILHPRQPRCRQRPHHPAGWLLVRWQPHHLRAVRRGRGADHRQAGTGSGGAPGQVPELQRQPGAEDRPEVPGPAAADAAQHLLGGLPCAEPGRIRRRRRVRADRRLPR